MSKRPEVWTSATYADMTRFGDEDAKWSFVKENVDGIIMHLNRVGHKDHMYDMKRLEKLVKVLNENHIMFGVEAFGTEYVEPPEKSGLISSKDQLEKLKPLYDVGGTCHLMNMDGPTNRLMNPDEVYPQFKGKGLKDLDACIEQTIIFMRQVKKAHPEIKLYELTNFPNWGYKGGVAYRTPTGDKMGYGDYFEIISRMIKKTKEANIPIEGVTVDNPWDYTNGSIPVEKEARVLEDTKQVDWMARLRDLEDYVKSEGLEFNLIINAQQAGYTSNKAIYDATLEYFDAYVDAGGCPTRYVVESWYTYPNIVEPEDGSYSLSATTKEIIKKVRQAY